MLAACTTTAPRPFTLDYDTKVDAKLQRRLEEIDARLRAKHGLTGEQAEVGLLDVPHLRVAMIHHEWIEYPASVAMIAILLAYFQLHPDPTASLDAQTQHELGLMI